MPLTDAEILQLFTDAEEQVRARLSRVEAEMRDAIDASRYEADHHVTEISPPFEFRPSAEDSVVSAAKRPFDTLAHTDTVVYLRNVNYLYGVTRLRGAWVQIDNLSSVTLESGGDYDGQYSVTAASADVCVWIEFNNRDAEITLAAADVFPAPSIGGTKWDYTEAMPLWYFPWDVSNSKIDWANRIDMRHSWQTVGF
jgi:hypothetical protein